MRGGVAGSAAFASHCGSVAACTGGAAAQVCPEAADPPQTEGEEAWESDWQRLLQALGHAAGQVVLVFDRNGGCRLARIGTALSCLGHDDGRDWRQRLPAPMRAVIEDLAQLAFAGVPAMLGVDCGSRHYRFRGLPLRHDGPLPDTVLVLGEDVTETDAALQALHVLGTRLLQLSERDGLLDIANRRCFERSLQREWRRCRREARSLAVMLVDLDDFKSCNDRHGHAWGDVCLRRVAGVLQQTATRPADLVARFGGDEFAVLLPDTDESGARTLAAQMHARLQGSTGPAQPAGLTLTIGVAAAVPGEPATADALLDLADRALYRGKQQGRNRTVAASELAT